MGEKERETGAPSQDQDRSGITPRLGQEELGQEELDEAPPRASAESFLAGLGAGKRVGRFVLRSKLGQGGMGAVFLAHDPELARDVAIKIIKPAKLKSGGQRAQKRMLREAQAMAMVSHPNLVVIYEVGTYDKTIFLAMEYVTGQTLSHWLRADPPLEDILEVFDQAGRALSAVHEAGLIHRDFKPDNVIVTPEGTPKVLDLGIARRRDTALGGSRSGDGHTDHGTSESAASEGAASEGAVSESAASESSGSESGDGTSDQDEAQPQDAPFDAFRSALTREGAVVGTPAYMPPEQLLGTEVTEAVDQFALAVSFYEALTGQKPFPGHTTSQLLASILSAKLRPWPLRCVAPLALRRAIERGMSAKASDRFASVGDFVAACRQGLGLRGQLRFLTARWLSQQKKEEYLISEGSLLEEGRRLLLEDVDFLSQEQVELLRQSIRHADRRRLVRRALLVGVVVLLAGLIPTALLLRERSRQLREARRQTASEHVLFVSDNVNDVVTQAASRVELIFAQRRTWLPRIRTLFSSDLPEAALLSNIEALNDYFRPILATSEGISSLKVTRNDDSEYLILEDPDARDLDPPYLFYNRVVVREAFGNAAFEVFLPTSPESRPRTSWLLPGEQNSRGTPWVEYFPTERLVFKKAINNPQGHISWTEPYLFFTTKDPGITGTISFTHDDQIYVLGIDYMLTDVSLLTSTLKSDAYWAVIVTRNGGIVGLPRDPRFDSAERIRTFFSDFDDTRRFLAGDEKQGDRAAELPSVTDLHIPALSTAVEAAPDAAGRTFFSYIWQGESYVGARAPVGDGALGLFVIVVEKPKGG